MDKKLPKQSIIMFDLDGTLAVSKSPITSQMANVLQKLLENKKVAIISGGAWPQFEKQTINHLSQDCNFKNLIIMPTSGASLFLFENKWQKIYEEKFTKEESEKIILNLKEVIDIYFEKTQDVYGEQIEDRGSQITFSALGQIAPIEEKSKYDPDQKKRLEMVFELKKRLPEFGIRIGGTTSIDITKGGDGKAGGIKKLAEYLKIPLSDIFYIGDAIFEGGNDYAAVELGLDYLKVKDESETLRILNTWL